MILLQLSAGQGPLECCKALGLALTLIKKQCQAQAIELHVLEAISGNQTGCFKSLLLQIKGEPESNALQFAQSWQGTMLWVCQSPYRPKHKRKNWFFSARVYEMDEQKLAKGVTFQTCRASGAGGQHVNTTDSAVRATHTETGVSVRVESERSQHANKRLASVLLFQKLEEARSQKAMQQEQVRWQQHWELERGNPVKTFIGEKFTLKH